MVVRGSANETDNNSLVLYRDSILCEDLSIRKVNDIISRKNFTKEETVRNIKESIVTLIKTMLLGKCRLVRGSLSIEVEDDKEQLNLWFLDEVSAPKFQSVEMCALKEEEIIDDKEDCCSHIERHFEDTDLFQGGRLLESLSPESKSEMEPEFSSTMYPKTEDRRSSDEESGYTSGSEKEEICSPCVEESSQPPVAEDIIKLGSPKHSLQIDERLYNEDKSDTSDDYDKDDEHPLVINENCIDESNQKNIEIHSSCCHHKKGVSLYKREVEVDVCTTDSEIPNTDSETSMEVCADSEVSTETEGTRYESMASKITDGILCKKCRNVFPDLEAFVSHSQEIHGLFSCRVCCKTFTSKNNLKRHERIHTGTKPYKCNQCEQSFARRDDLKGHQLRHEYTKPFRCSLCSKGYTDRAGVKNHMAKEHGSTLMHVCPQCGESFDKEEEFSAHKRSHPELQQYSCNVCPFIGTNNLMTLKHKLHHSHKLFSCKPCGAYFADPFDYTNHARKHKKDAQFTSYTCCFCDAILPTYEQFVRHEYSHAHTKTYSCKQCFQQFKNKQCLQQHLLSSGHNTDETKLDPQETSQEKQASNAFEERPEMDKESKIIFDHYSVNYDYCNEVLDLSTKKQVDKEEEPRNTSSLQSEGQAKLLDAVVPRNGCNPELPCLSLALDTGVSSSYLQPRQLLKNKLKSLLSSPYNGSMVKSNLTYQEKREKYNKNKPSLVMRSMSKEIDEIGIHRFNPYRREKLADFASKFLAVRGLQYDINAKTNKEKGKDNDRISSKKDWNFHLHTANSLVMQNSDSSRNVEMNVLPQIEQPNKSDFDYEEKYSKFHGKSIENLPTFVKREIMPEGKDFVVCSQTENEKISIASELGERKEQSCDICNKKFESFDKLESHSVDLHKRYLCQHCGKSFTAKPNRDRHVRYHTGERPYKCDLCDQAFFRGDDLKYHRTTRHPAAHPFTCKKCSATFSWHRDLDRHLRHSKCKHS